MVDERVPVRMERWGDEKHPAVVAETNLYRAYQVRWPVLDGVTGEGLWLKPKFAVQALVVVIPDANQTPEQVAGLVPVDGERLQFARQLAESGVDVVIPALIDRTDEWSGHPEVAFTNQPHREWIYRQAYHMGRHVIGYEVQKVLAAIDCRQLGPHLKIGIAGCGEGGLIALASAALDDRVQACLVSGYFEPHNHPWEEPLYRNVFGLYREFGDAELASMIAPRGLVIEHSPFPQADSPPPVKPGRRPGAAVGRLATPSFDAVKTEFARIATLVPEKFQQRELIAGAEGATVEFASPRAVEAFDKMLGVERKEASSGWPTISLPDARERQHRQVTELERHVQRLVRGSDAIRRKTFPMLDVVPAPTVEEFQKQTAAHRERAWNDLFGRWDDPLLAPQPKSRQIYDRPKWTGYDVTLEVFPDVFAWGVLLLPKDLQPGEKRPVVVCQHGRNGLPKDTIEGDQPAYHDFAAKLADEGFIVFAPHNPYRGEDRYRFLSRKANAVGRSLFSFILAQHQQILNWLKTVPGVDPERIAFYGLSYGGETAVRVPPLLEDYCLSICSADFNDWARKVAATDAKFSFMFTIEWEMPYFNMGSTFNYAELSALMAPRPFMVERGHEDGVAPDEWVAYEYAKVRRLYDRLKIGDRTEIEFFDGPHTIHGVGTFEFLHRQLKWPKR